jgi:hypothetical protein
MPPGDTSRWIFAAANDGAEESAVIATKAPQISAPRRVK